MAAGHLLHEDIGNSFKKKNITKMKKIIVKNGETLISQWF